MTRTQSCRSGLLYFLFYAVLANIPYWIASEVFAFQPRGWFCIEYPLVGIVSLFLPNFARGILLVLLFLADFECGIYDSYYLSVRQCLDNSNVFLNSISSARHDVGILIALLLLGMAATATSRMFAQSLSRGDRGRLAISLLAFATLAATLETAGVVLKSGAFHNLQHPFGHTDTLRPNASSIARIARVPVYQLISRELSETGVRVDARKNRSLVASVTSATALALDTVQLMRSDGERQMPDIVLVIVESWGLARDSRLNQAVLEPYRNLQGFGRYYVEQGAVPFHGGTIAGESRELCGNSLDFSLLDSSQRELGTCVPARLAALGYRDIAVHGMSGHMFARSDWYPVIGFQESWFNSQLKEQGLPDCVGAFIGTCDSAIAGWIENRLEERNRKPYFFHWVTLNSHLPLPIPTFLKDAPLCLQLPYVAPDSALCSWYQLITNVHRSVARVAAGTRDRPTVLVVVGDHAPPFSEPTLHASFSQFSVPYLLLLPRNELPSNFFRADRDGDSILNGPGILPDHTSVSLDTQEVQ